MAFQPAPKLEVLAEQSVVSNSIAQAWGASISPHVAGLWLPSSLSIGLLVGADGIWSLTRHCRPQVPHQWLSWQSLS